MNSQPADHADRDRFTQDWTTNLAVVANAGSGKTTSISRRLAAMALSEEGGELLARTAVVTYTKKAAEQIGRRAREELLSSMEDSGGGDAAPLGRLDRAFFGTIHSYCILLARTHGSTLGVHLNPTLIERDDDAPWEEFVEQDPMQFNSLAPAQVDAFLRHASLRDVFELAKKLDHSDAEWLAAAAVPAAAPGPDAAALAALLGAASQRKGKAALALERNKEAAAEWARAFAGGGDRLPIPRPEGKAAGIEEHYRKVFAPLKEWLAMAGGALAAELSFRFRAWRQERGYQTYSDQVETAREILRDGAMLRQIRSERRRVLLDEAQDTDPVQFSVLVEITRPRDAEVGTWPGGGGPGPLPGHFCMVGDAQQCIYGTRTGIRNFLTHVRAFETGDAGERLTFSVTFRAPRRVVALLNDTMPAAFGHGRDYNSDVPSADGAPGRFLQVPYERLEPGPSNAEGGAWRFPVVPVAVQGRKHVGDRKLENEARQLAQFLAAGGPEAVGAAAWGDLCILAPRNDWLAIVRDEFEAAGIKTALQVRRSRNGDNPAYAWVCGLLCALCDPENPFEWAGVLREVFAVSDSVLASAMRGAREIRWEEPEAYPAPMRAAVEVLAPFLLRVDGDGERLGQFAADLSGACGLAEKAAAIDADGGLGDELARLLAQADEMGLAGASPRDWLRALLTSIDARQPSVRPASDAVNLITSHSAKGLEWPVVIPVGMWREIGSRGETGLRIVTDHVGGRRVVLDAASMVGDARLSKEREQQRDHVRLLYVTLTRAKAALVVPWAEGQPAEDNSFTFFWGMDPSRLALLAQPGPSAGPPEAEEAEGGASEVPTGEEPANPAPAFPKRLLPHELAGSRDLARSALHESSLDEPGPAKDAIDPLDYGVWWHRLLEFVPWGGLEPEAGAYGAPVVAGAQEGFRERAAEEWRLLLASEPWALMRESRWKALAEVGIFAPFGTEGWIDGIMDLVLHDPVAGEVWIVDWKTNRRRVGEDDAALLARLSAEYAGQLGAYGACAQAFFPGCTVRKWVYSTVAGAWTEVMAN